MVRVSHKEFLPRPTRGLATRPMLRFLQAAHRRPDAIQAPKFLRPSPAPPRQLGLDLFSLGLSGPAVRQAAYSARLPQSASMRDSEKAPYILHRLEPGSLQLEEFPEPAQEAFFRRVSLAILAVDRSRRELRLGGGSPGNNGFTERLGQLGMFSEQYSDRLLLNFENLTIQCRQNRGASRLSSQQRD